MQTIRGDAQAVAGEELFVHCLVGEAAAYYGALRWGRNRVSPVGGLRDEGAELFVCEREAYQDKPSPRTEVEDAA